MALTGTKRRLLNVSPSRPLLQPEKKKIFDRVNSCNILSRGLICFVNMETQTAASSPGVLQPSGIRNIVPLSLPKSEPPALPYSRQLICTRPLFNLIFD